jgi:acyl-CoA thioesterase YciA
LIGFALSEQIENLTPRGELAIRVLAMPANTNQNGDIFGGWLLGQMDIAGETLVTKLSKGRCVTVAVDSMSFRKPVFVGDVVGIYVELLRVGTTSASVSIEAWVTRRHEDHPIPVTQGKFTYVAIDEEGTPRAIALQGRAP